MGRRVQRIMANVPEPQMTQALIAGWHDLFGFVPTRQQIAMVLAQNDLETNSRKAMWNYNVGNITTDGNGSYDYFDDLTTNEQMNPGSWKKMRLKYRAYPDLLSGVKDYLHVISTGRYASAWQHILHPDPAAFSKSLKASGYYTANEAPYTKLLTNLYNRNSHSDSYQLAMSGKVNPYRHHSVQQEPSELASLEQTLDKYIGLLFSSKSVKQFYKRALPTHDILIKITTPNYTDAIEFARILSCALDEDLLTKTYTHSNGQQVEVECQIAGPQKICQASVEQMSEAVTQAFYQATQSIGSIMVKTECQANSKSSYQPISLKTASSQYRSFHLKFAKKGQSHGL